MKRILAWFWIVGLLGSMLAIAGLYMWPRFYIANNQDECSFGPVSNARYRDILKDVERRQSTTWPQFIIPHFRTDELNYRLREELMRRFYEMRPDGASIYEEIATMHAVMRGLNARYIDFISSVRPMESEIKPYPWYYQLDGADHGFLNLPALLFYRWTNLTFFLVLKPTDNYRSKIGSNGKSVLVPTRFKPGDWYLSVRVPPNPLEPEMQIGEIPCPSVPTAEWARHFDEIRYGLTP